MNSKICFTAFILSFILLASCSQNRKQLTDDSFLEKNGNIFTFTHDGEEDEKYKLYNVDSIAVGDGVLLVYGSVTEKGEKTWHAQGTPGEMEPSKFLEQMINIHKQSVIEIWNK